MAGRVAGFLDFGEGALLLAVGFCQRVVIVREFAHHDRDAAVAEQGESVGVFRLDPVACPQLLDKQAGNLGGAGREVPKTLETWCAGDDFAQDDLLVKSRNKKENKQLNKNTLSL